MRLRKIRKKRTYSPDIHHVVFVVLLSVICIERSLTLFTFSAGLECLDQRDLSIGSIEGENGIYDWLALIAVSSFVLTGIALINSVATRKSISISAKAIATVNSLIALGLLSLSAIPWAYYNVGHPLSDLIYDVRNAIAPDLHYAMPQKLNWYPAPNAQIWECVSDECSENFDDLNAEFVHRELKITLKNMVVSDCMSQDFNVATKLAIGDSAEGYTGDKRRFARVYFDEMGRFVGPRDPSVFTPYLRQQFSDAQLESSDWDFEELIITIHTYEENLISEGDTQLAE